MSVRLHNKHSVPVAATATFKTTRLFAALLVALAGTTAVTSMDVAAAGMSPAMKALTTSGARDSGPASTSDVVSFALVLKLRNTDQLAQFISDSTDPSSSSYHQFLTPAQFTAKYGPSATAVNATVRNLNVAGIGVTGVSDNQMVIYAQGPVSAVNRYFSTTIHNYAGAQLFRAPVSTPVIPAAVSSSVAAVVGLSTQPVLHSMATQKPNVALTPAVGSSFIPMTGIPGQYSVKDVANFYQVNPLYAAKFDGTGRTLGITTLATFNPKDAFAYWKAMGVKVSPTKISRVRVDGGATFPGSDETTLDVEQSGGLAPGAKVIVYDGPNTDQGFLDSFLRPVMDNKVDTLSVSWGTAEITVDPSTIAAYDQVFAQAAAQGITIFASSGDSGGYDFNFSNCDNVLTVDHPASSPYVVAAGGLTLPGIQSLPIPTPVVNVPTVRPWAWDYLENWIDTNYGAGTYLANDFPVGAGGGVSVTESRPSYQNGTPGIQTSAAGQSVTCDFGSGYVDLLDLPSGFQGRNVPDLALNADPETGYLVYYQGGWLGGFGGTSFVAPQLNGIFNVIVQATGSRLGLVNRSLYKIAALTGAYGPIVTSPKGKISGGWFTDIVTGDNLGWNAVAGYDVASGLGSINAYNLATALKPR